MPAQPGESRNPTGQRSAGRSIRELINDYRNRKLTAEQLRAIAEDEKLPFDQRYTAIEILKGLTRGDMADFEPIILGPSRKGAKRVTLQALRDKGIDTSVVKKMKQGEFGIEIELHDRGSETFERIIHETDGTPTRHVQIEGQLPDLGDIIVRRPISIPRRDGEGGGDSKV